MTREIKFRAWDKETKKMYYKLVKPRTDENIGDELIIQFDCTGYSARTQSKFIGSDCLMQYTGLKDKNGKEIYEGDIIGSSLQGSENFEIWQIEINPYSAIQSPQGKAFDNSWIEHEVIGNIYDNPDLLNND